MSPTSDKAAGARRLAQIPPYLFAEIDRKVQQKKKSGVDVISLGIGDPDLPTPARIVSVLQEAAADAANHRYPSYFGLAELREAGRVARAGLDVSQGVCDHGLIRFFRKI